MNDELRQILCDLIQKHGRDLIRKPKRLDEMLNDACAGQHRGARRLLVETLREGVVDELTDVGPNDHENLVVARVQQKLIDNLLVSPDAARWAVQAWATALQSDDAVARSRGGPRPTLPPPVTTTGIFSKEIVSTSTGLKLALIPAGTFTMGSPTSDNWWGLFTTLPTSEENRRANEGPSHVVRISQPFYMGRYEVTQAEFQQVMGRNPSSFASTGCYSSAVAGQDTTRFPVESVSWFDAVEFCNKLSAADGLTPHYRLTRIKRRSDQSIKAANVRFVSGTGYRLPTEAEWEYACRAGTTTPFHFGGVLNGDKANVDGNFPYGTTTKGKYWARTTQVGSYPANAFGLYDMHGNVWEWCQDVHDENAYSSRSGTTPDPLVTSGSEDRVLRGGSWHYVAWRARSANRDSLSVGRDDVGFRVVCVGVWPS